jgi:hypothetical protein
MNRDYSKWMTLNQRFKNTQNIMNKGVKNITWGLVNKRLQKGSTQLSPYLSSLHLVRIKKSCYSAQWISKTVQSHMQKFRGKSTSKICIYFINIDCLLTIKTLDSLGVKMHDFQSKGYSLLVNSPPPNPFNWSSFNFLSFCYYFIYFPLHYFNVNLSHKEIFYKYCENRGLIYLLLLTIKYIFVEI